MCGIIGYLGRESLKNHLSMVCRLEYRGYDSAGVAFHDGGDSFSVARETGRVENFPIITGTTQ